MASVNNRKADRVAFDVDVGVQIMGIDGTWARRCKLENVSETGASLSIEGPLEGLPLKEFFLVLSATGLAYRRCELAWVNGSQIGARFLKPGLGKRTAASAIGTMP